MLALAGSPPRGGMGRAGIGRFISPASSISFAGAGAGLNTATSCPRSASSRAIGTSRVGKPRSFTGNIVNRNLDIDTLHGIVYVYFLLVTFVKPQDPHAIRSRHPQSASPSLIFQTPSLTTGSRISTIAARSKVECLPWRNRHSNGLDFSRADRKSVV